MIVSVAFSVLVSTPTGLARAMYVSRQSTLADEVDAAVRQRVSELGLAIRSVGIRDIVLPGEMKDLMNKVAEANSIVRRKETAAICSQANTGRLLSENPTRMRLQDLKAVRRDRR